MAGHPLGQLFSKLHEAFAAPGGTPNRLVIDRRTIEKTWKYMDKVWTLNVSIPDVEGTIQKRV